MGVAVDVGPGAVGFLSLLEIAYSIPDGSLDLFAGDGLRSEFGPIKATRNGPTARPITIHDRALGTKRHGWLPVSGRTRATRSDRRSFHYDRSRGRSTRADAAVPGRRRSASAGDLDLPGLSLWDLPFHDPAAIPGDQVDGHPIGREERRDRGAVFIDDPRQAAGGHTGMAGLGIDLKGNYFQTKTYRFARRS